jgi:glycosyltransferase involved in cell wall biosynthesis
VIKYLVNSQRYELITVVLPNEGALSAKLLELGVEIKYLKLALLSKTYLKKLKWGKIIFPLLNFKKKLNLLNSYDIIYTNTSVILDFYLLAPFIKGKKILHVREIPARWLSNILSFLIKKADTLVIFNSVSTKNSFKEFKKSIVIYNAFEGFEFNALKLQEAKSSPLKILLIGRINSWKGQDFTINALSKIKNENFILTIVGNTSAGNESLLTNLQMLVRDLGMEDKVFFHDFALDTTEFYQNTDLVVVPSKKPEPFGRVAIEAMSIGRPVLAANHGGLPEIVSPDAGMLFTPNDEREFNKAVQSYINDRTKLIDHGRKAKENFETRFSIAGFYKQLDQAFNN